MAKPPAEKPKAKAEPKPKLTGEERSKHFIDMAHEVDALQEPVNFNETDKKIAAHTSPPLSKLGGLGGRKKQKGARSTG